MGLIVATANFYLTNAGKAAALDAANNSIDIEMTQIALGTAKYDAQVTAPTQTALTTEVGRYNLVGGGSSGQVLRLTTTLTPNYTAEIFEIGLFLSDGTLFAVAAVTGTDPLMQTANGLTSVITLGCSLAEVGSNVTVSVDANSPISVVLMNQHLDHPDPHPQYSLEITALQNNKFDKAGGAITGNLTIKGQTYARAVWIQSNVNNSNMAMSIDSWTNQVLFQHSPISGAGGFKFDKRLEAKTEVKSETLKVDNGNNVTTFSHQIGGGKSLIQTDCNVFEMNRLLYMGANTYNRATNGYSYLPNGVLLQWGVIDYSETSFLGGSHTDERYILVNFPLVFPNATLNVQTCVMAPFVTCFTDWFPQTSQISASQFYIILQNWDNAAGLADKPKVQWMAIGY